MNENMSIKDKIVQTIQAEFTARYGDGKRKEVVRSMQKYKSLPITDASKENEVGFVLQEVFLVSKLKELPNGEVIPVYEVFGENGAKILETQDDGLMKFDREIFEEMIKDKIAAIQASGYDVASITLDGKIESFFEMINGKVIAINKEQKARLDKGADKEALRERIDGETANPELDEPEEKEPEKEQEKKQKEQDERKIAEQVSQELGFTIHQMTKIDDPIFRMNNPQTRGADLYVALTHDDQVKFITMEDGVPKEAEGFQNSGRASGRTTKVINDLDMLDDNEINTYGEIYPTGHDNMRYTIEKGQYGDIKLVEQIRYDGTKMSKTDAWISREVQSDHTNYLDINREGAENSDNITARTFNQASQNTDANKYGHSNNQGGLSEVGQAMKDKPTNTNMESLAADTNNRYDAAKKMVVDVAYKQGYSLDPDADPDTSKLLDKRVRDMVDNMNGPFTEDTANAVLMEIQMEQRTKDSQKQAQDEQEKQDKEDEQGRSRLEEEYQRKMGKR
ncbi:MAG: hypothetical protein IKE91_08610 [Clostridia bacterium]|nr:hypothetical protein [Clostridia bacterium]